MGMIMGIIMGTFPIFRQSTTCRSLELWGGTPTSIIGIRRGLPQNNLPQAQACGRLFWVILFLLLEERGEGLP